MRRVNFDTQLLRSLIAVIDSGSFVAAAEQLNMTQPAMSQQMRRLEDQVGAPLFRRDGRKLTLTTQAERLVDYARRIIALNDEICDEFGVSKKGEIVHIGMPEHFSESLLPILIAEAYRLFPNIQLVVKVARSQALEEGLTDGRLNIAILMGPPSGADATPAQPVPLRWIRSEGFVLDDSDQPLPLVLFRSPCEFRNIATQTLEMAGLKWRCVHEGEDLATLRAAVLANIGITALPMVRDYVGLKTVAGDVTLPKLPNVAFQMKRHPNWKSRSANGLSEMVQAAWNSFNPSSIVTS